MGPATPPLSAPLPPGFATSVGARQPRDAKGRDILQKRLPYFQISGRVDAVEPHFNPPIPIAFENVCAENCNLSKAAEGCAFHAARNGKDV